MISKARAKEIRRTKKGLVGAIYNNQQGSSRERGHTPPTYTVNELRTWFRNHPMANALYDAWRLSGYRQGLIPSVDRIDDSKGYSFDNIQLMTWAENKAKGYADTKSGRMKHGKVKAVIQYDVDGEYVQTYHSLSEASRQTGVGHQCISGCCKGKGKTAGGFKWKYKKDNK